MIDIDLDNKSIRGKATVKEIREKGLIEASIEHKEV